MTAMTLYELTEEYREALQSLTEMDLDEQTVSDTLEGLQGAIEVKAQNVAMFIRNLEVGAEAIKEAESRMAARRKAIENRVQRIKQYLLMNMRACGISKIESPYLSVSIRKNPVSVVIDNSDAIPPEYMRQPEPPPPSPDKKAIAEAIKSGKEIPGAHTEQSERVHIA